MGWFLGVFPAARVAVGEGWLRGCCCACAGDAPWTMGVDTLYAVLGRLDAEDGFAGCEGVGVAMLIEMFGVVCLRERSLCSSHD